MQRPGTARASRLVGLVQMAQSQPELAFDLRRVASSLSELGTAYLELILGEGPLDDDEAAKRLKVSAAELQIAVKPLDRLVSELGD
jgi:hypothetical protein